MQLRFYPNWEVDNQSKKRLQFKKTILQYLLSVRLIITLLAS